MAPSAGTTTKRCCLGLTKQNMMHLNAGGQLHHRLGQQSRGLVQAGELLRTRRGCDMQGEHGLDLKRFPRQRVGVQAFLEIVVLLLWTCGVACTEAAASDIVLWFLCLLYKVEGLACWLAPPFPPFHEGYRSRNA
eukprot:280031-Pelagomonas_calceolata.AAC.3